VEFSLSPLECQRLASLLAATATLLLGHAGEQVDELRQGDTVQPPSVPPQTTAATPDPETPAGARSNTRNRGADADDFEGAVATIELRPQWSDEPFRRLASPGLR